MKRDYDIIVIGGGHAGAEAAWSASRLGASVALITLDPLRIAQMSCNPAIGGLAKGQMTREIDALGGLMGIATDNTGIQFRMLNRSKGPAVWGPRAQADKYKYASEVQRLLGTCGNLEIVGGEVVEIVSGRSGEATERRSDEGGIGASGVVSGVVLADGIHLACRAVIVTTGTFLRGLMHTGEVKSEGGRVGEPAAKGLSASLARLGLELGRLKTGTPPRLHRDSIDYSKFEVQPGDENPCPFSYINEYAGLNGGDSTGLRAGHVGASGSTVETTGVREERRRWWASTPTLQVAEQAEACTLNSGPGADGAKVSKPRRAWAPALPQVCCWLSGTNEQVHEVIRANLHRAPMYSGQIQSTGPRYCPSIEDKVVRFAANDSHHVFLEPEGLDTDEIYCNGISTSLPADVQEQIVRLIPGLEKARILRYGYAIEYDMVWPSQIRATLETKAIRGLFLAGQINGTSGYEEAAAQGIVAGINAFRFLRTGEADFVLRRDQAYIGVLIDDLVTKPPIEPYRMFTSRAEHRLHLRNDNADERLTALGREAGLVDDERWRQFQQVMQWKQQAMDLLRQSRIEGIPAADWLKRPTENWAGLVQKLPAAAAIPPKIGFRVEIVAKYQGYIARQDRQIERFAEFEDKLIPTSTDYARVVGLRNEARQKLAKFTPHSLGQALRISGITPADVTVLAIHLDRVRA